MLMWVPGWEASEQGCGRSGQVWASCLEEEAGGHWSRHSGAEVRAGRELVAVHVAEAH